jgi:hypothetical protein
MTILARYQQYEFYDPMTDRVIMRMSITEDKGTWWADVPKDRGSKTRQRRDAFQTHVMQSMALGHKPKQVVIG